MRLTVPAHLPAKSYLETEAGSQGLSEQKLNSEMRFQGFPPPSFIRNEIPGCPPPQFHQSLEGIWPMPPPRPISHLDAATSQLL